MPKKQKVCTKAKTTMDQHVYVNDKMLAERYGVTRKTIWKWVRENSFPKPRNFSPKCTRWRMSEVLMWEK